jgi:hypothetical protein
MSILAQEVDELLQKLEPERAQQLEAAIRGALALASVPEADLRSAGFATDGLDALTAYAEPMGPLTNEEIDRAIYGS